MKKVVSILSLAALVILGIFFLKNTLWKKLYSPREPQFQEGITLENGQEDQAAEENLVVLSENLDIPWEIVFLPNKDMLVTERSGSLLRIGKERELISKIEGVEHVGEGGLLGLAIHPDFEKNRWIYLYLTTKTDRGLTNRVERYRLENNMLSDKKIVLKNIAGAIYHDGGRMEFGPDGYLYITTGDARNQKSAQDVNSLNGKILRIKDDGSIPDENPFGNPIFSYGHRNPQGLAWDESNRLWITEHGPSGFNSGFDEINLIETGGNYGWPEVYGDENQEGMIAPVVQSGSDDTWAPAGMVYWDGSFFFTGLRGEALYEARLSDQDRLDLKVHLYQEFGRLRALVLGDDGYFYLTTSNKDGRGEENPGDDKIIKINPQIFR